MKIQYITSKILIHCSVMFKMSIAQVQDYHVTIAIRRVANWLASMVAEIEDDS